MENLKLKYEVEYLENKVKRLEHDVEFWRGIAEKYMSYFEKNENKSWLKDDFEDNKRMLNKRG